jgi:hypothetical protein
MKTERKMYNALISIRNWDIELYKELGYFTIPQTLRMRIKNAVDLYEKELQELINEKPNT